jgi:choline-sulfatase
MPGEFRKLLRRLGRAIGGVLLLAGCSREPEPAPFKPNVLLVVIDCLRADHVGAYGYSRPTTPHLDSLAAEGIRFESAYANGTWTKPSMATLFSGLYPSEHGLLRVGVPAGDVNETDALPDGIPMLAERFAAAGYRTIAAVNQIHLKPEFGFGRGFDDYRWMNKRSGYDLNRLLFEAMAGAKPDQPVFAWVHYLDLHWPYKHWRKNKLPELGATEMAPEPPVEQSRAAFESWIASSLTEDNRRGLEARYDHGVRFVDEELGELIERFRAAGKLDDTLVIVTADHGEGFFEHKSLTHGFEPYDEVARVPFIVRPPSQMKMPLGVRKTLVSHVDLAPTLLDLLDLPPLPGASGTSYEPALREGREMDRAVLIQTELSAALRSGTRKLILRSDKRIELYDLAADPGEKRNLAAGGCTGDCATLKDELVDRLRALGPPRGTKRGTFTAEETDELKALGYL